VFIFFIVKPLNTAQNILQKYINLESRKISH